LVSGAYYAKVWRVTNSHLIDYVVITLADVTAGLIVWLFGRQWFVKQLSEVKWQQSGDAWWLACDLHSIKLLADMNNIPKMRTAIGKSLGHAKSMGMDDRVLSEVQELQTTYTAKTELTDADKEQIRQQVDTVIDRCGKLAELNQPSHKP
jgi:hypothetical protein